MAIMRLFLLTCPLRLNQAYGIADANDARVFGTPVHSQEVLPRLYNSLEHSRILLRCLRIQVDYHAAQVLAIGADMSSIIVVAKDQ